MSGGEKVASNLSQLVEKLRQEQELTMFYKSQIRQASHALNHSCDTVFQSLWLNQLLHTILERVKTYHTPAFEWPWALKHAKSVVFVDASKSLKSPYLIQNYSRFLDTLLGSPTLLVELLQWAESHGLDVPALASDLMSVIYGHCVFHHDHTLLLTLLKELMRRLVSQARNVRDIFSGVEPVFSQVLSDYCGQLGDLRAFLTEVFQEPLAEVLVCKDYLEFDVNKAGSRFQTTVGSPDGRLLDGSAFLFSEDLETGCQHLANLSSIYLERLHQHSGQFPASLKWVLGSLKGLIRRKWPEVSVSELRCPVSAILFGPILGSAIVNPDTHGISELDVVVGQVARYNLSQITSVLQGSAWVLEKQTGKYPIQKVIKKMNTDTYCSLLDSLDDGCGEGLLDLPSALPGLRRSAYLASQAQLNNLVGLVCAMESSLSEKTSASSSSSSTPSSSSVHTQLTDLRRQLSQAVQLASRYPYCQPSSQPPSTPTKKPSYQRAESADTPGWKVGGRKREKMLGETVRLPHHKTGKKRSNSTTNLHALASEGPPPPVNIRNLTRSISPKPQLLNTNADLTPPSSLPGGGQILPADLLVPSEVLIFPISTETASNGAIPPHKLALLDFALLSEEEFMKQHCTPTFKRIGQFSRSASPSPSPLMSRPPPPSPPLPTSSPSSPSALSSPSLPFTSSSSDIKAPRPILSTDISQDQASGDVEPTTKNDTAQQCLENGLDVASNDSARTHNGHVHASNGHNCHQPQSLNSNRTLVGESHSGTPTRPLATRGSEASLSVPSQDASLRIPKKRSLTFTILPGGKFTLNTGFPSLQRNSTDSSDSKERRALSRSPSPCHPSPSPSPPHPSASPSPHCSSISPSSPLSVVISPPPLANGLCTHTPSKQFSPCTQNKSHPPPTPDSDRESASDDHLTSDLSPVEGRSLEDLTAAAETQAGRSKWPKLFTKGRGRGKGKGKRKTDNKKGKKKSVAEEEGEKDWKKTRSVSVLSAMEEEDQKLRSMSETDCRNSAQLDAELEASPQALFKRNRRSYTKIMNQYVHIIREANQRKQDASAEMANEDDDNGEDELPFEVVSVSELSPLSFRRSLFCNQLKYKLRSALQAVHTPISLPLGHTHTNMLLESEGETEPLSDCKYQLMCILQGALQRSNWFHDNMQIALLTETLNMVQQLPNSLVATAIEGAHEDHARRSSYLRYLMHSYLKFQDIQLLVGAMQAVVQRMQEVLKEQFIQLSVQHFLREQEIELMEFSRKMSFLSLTDEKCDLMEKNLDHFTGSLVEEQTWRYWPKEDLVTVSHCLENHLFSYVYQHMFHPNMEADEDRDKIFSAHLTNLSEHVTPNHKSLQISPIYHSGCPWTSAQKHLKAMPLFKSPRGKVHCVVESCRVLISLLQYAKVGSPPGADDMFPVLVYVLIKANPPSLLSTVQYVRHFLEDDRPQWARKLVGEESYWWAQFSTAVEFTKTLGVRTKKTST